MKIALATLAALVAVVGLAIGGWQLGWWMKSNATNRTAHIYQQSYGAQSADVQEVQQLVTQADGIDVQIADPSTPTSEVSSLRAQRIAIVDQACGLIANITYPPNTVATFAAANC